ncbi:MAG: ABC transporter substrate-binding protein [Rhodospirillales bacterium]|nr:ABC transporter substrate-binding protein [Rhodospirillales bacterium]
MAIVLQESLRAAFYAPFYAAFARGAYARAGVDVAMVSAPSPAEAARGLLAGRADLCWGGPMRVMATYQADPSCDLVCFGEAVTRDPFLLIGARPNPGFAFADLLSCRLGSVSEVPTPWLCLQHDLRLAGIDPARVARIADRTMAENAAALAAGAIDVAQVFEPYASALIESGRGHLWYAAATRGPTAYTCFYTRRATLAARREEITRMVAALDETLGWIAGADPAEIAATVKAYFPDVAPGLLASSYARYQALGIWGRDPVLPEEGYERLRASLVSGGFVDPGAPFARAVDNGPAAAIVARKRGSD